MLIWMGISDLLRFGISDCRKSRYRYKTRYTYSKNNSEMRLLILNCVSKTIVYQHFFWLCDEMQYMKDISIANIKCNDLEIVATHCSAMSKARFDGTLIMIYNSTSCLFSGEVPYCTTGNQTNIYMSQVAMKQSAGSVKWRPRMLWISGQLRSVWIR